MEANTVMQAISTLGFPIVSCVALFWGCKYMMDQQQKNTDKMFDMYDKSNGENRAAIQECTKAIEKLADILEEIKK